MRASAYLGVGLREAFKYGFSLKVELPTRWRNKPPLVRPREGGCLEVRRLKPYGYRLAYELYT